MEALLRTLAHDQVLNQTGIYVQDQIVWDRLIPTLGAREDFSQITTLSQVTSEGVTVPDNSSNDDNHHTERFGITYLLDGGWAPYASYATSKTRWLSRRVAGKILRYHVHLVRIAP